MSRFLVLIIFAGWLTWAEQSAIHNSRGSIDHLLQPGIFLLFYVLLILTMAGLGRRLAQRVDSDNFHSSLNRFNRLVGLFRLLIPAWFIFGVYCLQWGTLVTGLLHVLSPALLHYETPGLLLGCLPAFAALMGLWVAQYPADIALREQGYLTQLDNGIPVRQPPTLAAYFRVNLRLQVLFTLAPILALVLLRDMVAAAIQPLHLDSNNAAVVESSISLLTAAVVFIFAPEILRRVVDTQPLPPGPIRQRLESICQRHSIGYRDILLWHTEHQMGNAAVMGLIPQVRYILMSDLLMETMTDEQIEAVFAHEIGHVAHRHLMWLVVFVATAMFAMIGICDPITDMLNRWFHDADWPAVAIGALSGSAMILLFFWISRRFERQADVFAGRWLQQQLNGAQGLSDVVDGRRLLTLSSGMGGSVLLQAASHSNTSGKALEPVFSSHVGLYGSTVFADAMYQVARVNCIAPNAWSWCHGSMQSRIDHLRSMTLDPSRTRQFDLQMSRFNALLIVALALFGAWAAWTLFHSA